MSKAGGSALALTASCLTRYLLFLTATQTAAHLLAPETLDWSLWELRFIEHLLVTRHCSHMIVTSNIY